MKTIGLLFFLALSLNACRYETSQVDVTLNIKAKDFSNDFATVCAKVQYIDANLTDAGHKLATRTLCKKGYVDQSGNLAIVINNSLSDWSLKYSPLRAENFTADIHNVKFYIKTQSGPISPESVNTSQINIYDHSVTGSVKLKF